MQWNVWSWDGKWFIGIDVSKSLSGYLKLSVCTLSRKDSSSSWIEGFLAIFFTVSTSLEEFEKSEWFDLWINEFPAFVLSLIPEERFKDFIVFCDGFRKVGIEGSSKSIFAQFYAETDVDLFCHKFSLCLEFEGLFSFFASKQLHFLPDCFFLKSSVFWKLFSRVSLRLEWALIVAENFLYLLSFLGQFKNPLSRETGL